MRCTRLAIYLYLILMLVGQTAHAQDYVPGEIIVKMKSGKSAGVQPSTMNFAAKMSSEKSMHLKGDYGKMGLYHFGLRKGQSVEQAVQDLNQDPDVEYAEPNYILRKTQSAGEVSTYSQEQMESMAASAGPLWATGGVDIGLSTFHQSKTYSAQSVAKPVIAVIDTGLDLNHPVFVNTGSIWTNPGEIAGNHIDDDGNGFVDDVHGWNFVDNSSVMYDDDGHGTHVSGIVLSVDQDILAPSLSPSRISIMPLKFLDGYGSGTTSNAIRAIYYAVQNGAVVMNNSWGGPSYSGALQEAIAYAYNEKIAFVAAAGNAGGNNDSSPMYPATYDVPNIISVAATTDHDNLASFSNYGKNTVHLGSPGVFIYSTYTGGGWATASGTSMATPFVAGVAIQMKVESPQMSGYQIKSIIFSKADPVGSLVGKVYTEARLDAAQAINYSSTAQVDSSQPAYYGALSQNRELASNLAGGGCGLVTKMIQSSRDRFGDGLPAPRGPQTWYVLLVLALIAAPIALAQFLRSRSPENRRRYERFKIDSEVSVQVGDKNLVGSISSISLGGVQLNTEAMLEHGGVVRMHISSPDGKENIEVEGKVVWRAEQKAYGVAFSNAPRSALFRIGEWTKALQKTG